MKRADDVDPGDGGGKAPQRKRGMIDLAEGDTAAAAQQAAHAATRLRRAVK